MAFAPFCTGLNCPLKSSCNHFKEVINIKKEIHWPVAPYNQIKKKCEFYSNYPANTLNETIKQILNGKN